MRQAKEDSTCNAERAIDLISGVKELHGFNSQELNKLLKDSDDFTVHCIDEKGSPVKIDVEKLASILPLHLIAVLISSNRDKELFERLLRGIRLLHSLCDLAPRQIKLEQVDIFIEAAFGAVHVTTKFLHIKLSAQQADLSTSLCAAEEQVINYICQQCEASLQFLQSLCQQKVFRERLLRNKSLPQPSAVADVSRLKAKVLSIVLDLLKTALIKDPKHLLSCSDRTCPMGLLQLNAMRLADIFSDDSNFRSYIIASPGRRHHSSPKSPVPARSPGCATARAGGGKGRRWLDQRKEEETAVGEEEEDVARAAAFCSGDTWVL
ncbi:hypothetical protein EZV62_010540 [Acer yangbiense]|uniref:Nodulin homeobox N-terminal domain-containing protein n=1 Tax=Acer yangbiense TaxID=1000413 RepID=A0A5C7I4P8_9ROSI|nr:hypothetical protein EZV62_010540 [Acer yangbiense]